MRYDLYECRPKILENKKDTTQKSIFSNYFNIVKHLTKPKTMDNVNGDNSPKSDNSPASSSSCSAIP